MCNLLDNQFGGPNAVARTDLESCGIGNCTVGKLPFGKIPLGVGKVKSLAVGKYAISKLYLVID